MEQVWYQISLPRAQAANSDVSHPRQFIAMRGRNVAVYRSLGFKPTGVEAQKSLG